jgi:resuscitation-promoting factor RpfB
MESYRWKISYLTSLVCLCLLLLNSCQVAQPATPQLLAVTLTADQKTQQVDVSPGSLVQDALTKAGISLEKLDRIEPGLTAAVTNGMTINVIRVTETFDVKEVTIPFERQVAKNESMPVSQTLLVQPGTNGQQEITYRYLYEDGKEVSKTIVKSVIIKEAVPEITMVGVQAPFAAMPIQGRLVYLIAGNAWIMEQTTGDRRPLISSGDLDGRVFSLSPDGAWLLFTRKPAESSADVINTLWVVSTSIDKNNPIDLKAKNVISYAGWIPKKTQTIAYSTVEPRPTAPGWQANNDLQSLTFSTDGKIKTGDQILEANSGGIYGWWGTTFAWSQDGKQLAYARPDSVGLVDIEHNKFVPMLNLIPYQTHSDWAWVPGINWGPDGQILFTVTHAPAIGQVSAEESPLFDMSAIILAGGQSVNLVPQSGMFTYPAASPAATSSGYQVAYLQAIFTEQSNTSRYRLVVMDRDGSNHLTIFPPEGSQGIETQQVVWAPVSTQQPTNLIAVIYQGNLWLVAADGKTAYQVTGDGLITSIDWK